MIRPLQPLDVVRYALLGGPGFGNRVYPLERLSLPTRSDTSIGEAAKLTLSLPGKKYLSLSDSQNGRIAAIGAARQRSGARSWEVSHLLLSPDDEQACGGLLSVFGKETGANGAERIFIRFQADDPLVDVAKGLGFVQCGHEMVYEGGPWSGPYELSGTVRPTETHDTYNLFRTYCASMPLETRSLSGLTLDQWSASQERGAGQQRHYIYESQGETIGWIRTTRRRRTGHLTMLVHPDGEDETAGLLDFGLSALEGASRIVCLVHGHQVLLQGLLEQRSFAPRADYVTLVKMIAIPSRALKAAKGFNVAPV